jgi:hypothetical protein
MAWGQPLARSAARTLSDTAMERRGAPASSRKGRHAPQGAERQQRLAALHSLGILRDKRKAGVPRAVQEQGRRSR